ncbi:pyridoxamine 5'-phosphate oxidase family protein [Alsobacter sp. KACC 23698]|uniref:Pyridoxamine 5'-phosphate oxidase family protein n=1 Tax=Alsobacter sp. KACC 23698 TaxID=3149229 RepID=A0AAU7JKW3_9HYPH
MTGASAVSWAASRQQAASRMDGLRGRAGEIFMGHRFAELALTDGVKALQLAKGSRAAYARLERGPDSHDRLGPDELSFIAGRDGFSMASALETGWPYVHFRGGRPGFFHALNDRTLDFADFRGNRQYVTAANLLHDGRVSLFLRDYPHQRRLKVLGRATVASIDDAPQLVDPSYPAHVERTILISVEAFDWNCPQHIRPRFTPDELAEALALLRQKIAELKAENAHLQGLPNSRAEESAS